MELTASGLPPRYTASALHPFCGYAVTLKKARPRTANLDAAADKGTRFHALVEEWCRDPSRVPFADDREIQEWLDKLREKWHPPVGCRTEVAWGLSPDGEHLHVEERPKDSHIYLSMAGKPLLTAGRADACWPDYESITLWAVDWKTGTWPVPAARENLQANAAARALAKRFGARQYVPGIYYARDGVFDWGDPITVGSVEDDAVFARIKASAELDETPRPGDHCFACWEKRACPTGAAYLAENAP